MSDYPFEISETTTMVPKEAIDLTLPAGNDSLRRIPESDQLVQDPVVLRLLESQQVELAETREQLLHSRNTVSKLEGLVGSLKSIILHMDNEKGRALLTGEIAAMEALLFGGQAMYEELLATEKRRKSNIVQSKIEAKEDSETEKVSGDKSAGWVQCDEPELVLPLEDLGCNMTPTTEDESTKAPKPEDKKARLLDIQALRQVYVECSSDSFQCVDKSKHQKLVSKNASVSSYSCHSDDTLSGASPTSYEEDGDSSNTSFEESNIPKESHPRVVGATYWKEFSSRTSPHYTPEQASMLEVAMKKKGKPSSSSGWIMASLFSY